MIGAVTSSAASFTAPDGLSIAYTLHAIARPVASRPRIALIHSLALDQSIWDGVVPLLTQHADVLTYDCRGHGRSGRAKMKFTPELFACAVDIVGPSNLKTLIETIPPYWAPMVAQFHRRVGHPEKDAGFLWSRSPLSAASSIRIPMLIAQGANDPRVKQAESEQIVDAMREAGVDHEYLLFPDEGHGWRKSETVEAFYTALDRFLRQYVVFA